MARRMRGVPRAALLAWAGSVSNGHWSELHPPQPRQRTSNVTVALLVIVVLGALIIYFHLR